jgi:hypothetical protein
MPFSLDLLIIWEARRPAPYHFVKRPFQIETAFKRGAGRLRALPARLRTGGDPPSKARSAHSAPSGQLVEAQSSRELPHKRVVGDWPLRGHLLQKERYPGAHALIPQVARPLRLHVAGPSPDLAAGDAVDTGELDLDPRGNDRNGWKAAIQAVRKSEGFALPANILGRCVYALRIGGFCLYQGCHNKKLWGTRARGADRMFWEIPAST